jgi:3'-5' exonuclease
MLETIHPDTVLFIDIETVPQYPEYQSAPDAFIELWDKKASHLIKEGDDSESIFQRAGIYAEFGKIVCVSAGFIVTKDGERTFRCKSFFGQEEMDILPAFIESLNRFMEKPQARLCAHNGKEFDFPFLARRILINGLRLPTCLDVAGKKPWEVSFLDTMELWKFGDYKHYTSLKQLTYIFGIPSPKEDIDGSQVAEVFWKERDLARIARYCERDVLAIAQLFLKYKGEPLIEESKVFSLSGL